MDIIVKKKKPIVVSCGLGTDSTAMIVGMKNRGIRPDTIVFADTGNEHEYTYHYLPIFNKWLEDHDMPLVNVIRYTPQRFKWQPYNTLAGNCMANWTLPSLAFGRKSCSLKWKGEPIDKWVTANFGERTAVSRAIGYDCSPADNKRFSHAQGSVSKNRPCDEFVYPLQEWGYNRDDCKQVILDAELPQPKKSSCFFCPAKKACELHETSVVQLKKIVVIEANAQPTLRKVKGLWRSYKTGRMTDYIRDNGLLPADWIKKAWEKWSNPERSRPLFKHRTNRISAEEELYNATV